jgi:HEAT repeat protein
LICSAPIDVEPCGESRELWPLVFEWLMIEEKGDKNVRTTKGGRRDDIRTDVDPPVVGSLIGDLASKDGLVRESARLSLIAVGRPAVGALIKLLADRNRQVRWEAAKALSQIADPAAAPALVRALEDDEFSVRWLAAKGLIALRSKGLAPLLRALTKRSDSVSLLQGAHHVVHELAKRRALKEVMRPLLTALEDVEPSLGVPPAARAALDALARARGQRGGRKSLP